MFSSRKIERATYDSIAYQYLAANTHADHDTLATLRRRFLPALEGLFTQVLVLAREITLLKLGTITQDSTKLKAKASKHKALSYGHASRVEAQLTAEVEALTERAKAADRHEAADGMDVPEEIARREQRLAAIAEANATVEAPATEREAQREAGRPPRGR